MSEPMGFRVGLRKILGFAGLTAAQPERSPSGPTQTVAELALSSGCSVRQILPEGQQTRLPSRTVPIQFGHMLAHSEDWIARHDVTRSSGERRWATQYFNELYSVSAKRFASAFEVALYDVDLETVHGCVRTRGGVMISESSLVNTTVAAAGFTTPIASLPGAFSLVASWSLNYAHWLMDSLPRLAAIDFQLSEMPVLLPRGAKAFHYDSLRALGIRQAIEMPADCVTVEKLRCVSAASRTGFPRAEFIQRLRQKFRENSAANTPPRRLYVSRELSSRRVVNEEEVFAIFRSHGFEKVLCEELTFDEQLSLFSSAEMIAGPHGAGIYNLLFARPGATIIEFYNPLRWDSAAARISSLLGFEHWHMYGDDVGDAYDMRLDPPVVAELLTAAEGLR